MSRQSILSPPAALNALETALGSAIRGKPEVIRLSLVCLLARGHLLIEDVPGVGKTTLAHSLARAIDYVLQIKKTPIVVNDSRGFYTSRCFGTFVQESIAASIASSSPAICCPATSLASPSTTPTPKPSSSGLARSSRTSFSRMRSIAPRLKPSPRCSNA